MQQIINDCTARIKKNAQIDGSGDAASVIRTEFNGFSPSEVTMLVGIVDEQFKVLYPDRTTAIRNGTVFYDGDNVPYARSVVAVEVRKYRIELEDWKFENGE